MIRKQQMARPNRIRLILVCGGAIGLSAVAWGIHTRLDAEAKLARATDDAAVLTVSVVVAEPGPAEEEIVLPGTVQAEYDTPIYARTNGYVKRWYTDIGARVKPGDLLAEIDSPELDQQVDQAKADLVNAIANANLAAVTAVRFKALAKDQWASQQLADDKTFSAAATKATVNAAAANVKRLEQLQSYERVVAPYDGIVTARETDVGDLINAGSGNGPELFRVADTSKLRIYVQVPQSYTPQIKPGVAVDLRFPEYPGRAFPAKLVRSADAMDPTARTMLVELEADNAKGELRPGGYTDVHFKLPVANPGVRVPANALLFRAEGLRVATAGPDGQVTLHEVTLAHDFGAAVEISTGLAPGDMVVINPPAALATGTPVRVRDDKPAHKGSVS